MDNQEKCAWTPGPWALREYGYGELSEYSAPVMIVIDHECHASGIASKVAETPLPGSSFPVGDAMYRANANLIAASPTLYDALSNLLDAIYSGASPTDAIDAAEDALAKARGEG